MDIVTKNVLTEMQSSENIYLYTELGIYIICIYHYTQSLSISTGDLFIYTVEKDSITSETDTLVVSNVILAIFFFINNIIGTKLKSLLLGSYPTSELIRGEMFYHKFLYHTVPL